jgi:hypothetical protein
MSRFFRSAWLSESHDTDERHRYRRASGRRAVRASSRNCSRRSLARLSATVRCRSACCESVVLVVLPLGRFTLAVYKGRIAVEGRTSGSNAYRHSESERLRGCSGSCEYAQFESACRARPRSPSFPNLARLLCPFLVSLPNSTLRGRPLGTHTGRPGRRSGS